MATLSSRNPYSVGRLFGNLKVRPKLMVLHNLFFLVLACAAYFSLIPLFERQVSEARAREAAVLVQTPEMERAYQDAISRAKITLFLVLGSIYIAAVVLLEA